MATFSVPDQVPPVAEDCEKLRKAMQGHYFHRINNWYHYWQYKLWLNIILVRVHLVIYLLICISAITSMAYRAFLQLVLHSSDGRIGNRREGNHIHLGSQDWKAALFYTTKLCRKIWRGFVQRARKRTFG